MKTKIKFTKEILTLLTFTGVSIFSYAQVPTSQPERVIELTGTSEIKLDPNIIYLSIELKEHKKKDHIIQIETLEEQVFDMLQKLGIPKENLKAYSTSGKQYDLLWRKSGLLISKRYNLKLTNVDLFQPLLTELGDADLFSVTVMEVAHTEIEKYKDEVMLNAINEAKGKASLLVSASGAKLGQVMEIREIDAAEGSPQQGERYGMYSGEYSSLKVQQTNRVSFNQILLQYKVNAKFRIE